MSCWHAVLCKPRREQLAEENLRNQGFEVYMPRMVTERRRAGQWKEIIEPLFPRYLFLKVRDDRQNLSPVRSTLGVVGFVRFGGMPATVPEVVISNLRSRADPESGLHRARASLFPAGTQVRFAAGPFSGLEGVFEMESADARVIVLLEFLGKTNRVTVNRDWVALAG